MARKRRTADKKTSSSRVSAVRRDSRGRFYDVETGKPISAERAKRFKVFYDPQGRARNTKGGSFASKPRIAPSKAGKRRAGLARAFKPGKASERGARQQVLVEKRRRRAPRPKVTDMRYVGLRTTQALAELFGINLADPVRGDFAALIEAQGRELGRGSFFVPDPIESREDRTILRGVEKATRAALRDVSGSQLVALQVNVVVGGGDVGNQALVVRADESAEVVGGVMATVFSVLGENGLDASDGNDDMEPVYDLGVEVIAYELE